MPSRTNPDRLKALEVEVALQRDEIENLQALLETAISDLAKVIADRKVHFPLRSKRR